jgi:hypothetical protein
MAFLVGCQSRILARLPILGLVLLFANVLRLRSR